MPGVPMRGRRRTAKTKKTGELCAYRTGVLNSGWYAASIFGNQRSRAG